MHDGAAEAELLLKAARGDEAAFLLLYERHRTVVFRFSCRMLGRSELAEDVKAFLLKGAKDGDAPASCS